MTRTALSLSPCEILKPAFPDCQEACDSGQTSCQPVLLNDGPKQEEDAGGVAPNDNASEGDNGANSFMSVMSIGVILLIIILFIMNLCIAIRRYLCRPRPHQSPGTDWPDEVPREQRSLRHVLFVNPGGSFNIGERLKKDSFTLDDAGGGDRPIGPQGENCPVAAWVHGIEMTPQQQQEGEEGDGFREGEVIGVQSPPVLTVVTAEVDPGGV
ncbi:hypothetical protein BSKO_08266 [Bryopsis sp. KO-2023]|nr:hypothetical protein BSKO_08266 [Bryopsis sp. KO-2023]